MKKFPPASTCAICDRPLSETGGKRLVATPSFLILRTAIQENLDRGNYPARLIRLTDNYRDVIVWLGGTIWTDDAASRAGAAFQCGEHPWVCQRCHGVHVCKVCGAPLDRTPVADSVDNDGRVWHSAHFAGFGDYGKKLCSRCSASEVVTG